ncbi:hypothetical protein AYO21_11127 [Fonsecaea monophora]|uniref:medium-chain acyl-CoA ligase n=1 Tax=Fonsecaea monophora TaxID=254056 RepID=A0A177EUF1_9EURO|nr:hypothetical protein AYO21_11127 [Fonsecaea monophora]KAH0844776.1 Acyl-coenzyme A synthetase ACSM5, mitochondrial [Fonsecaea pedrosoi]OAG34692.1 hypothetical protein AYO21_11127 [Fonsecaea monophora]
MTQPSLSPSCPVDPSTQPQSFNFATHIVDHWARVAPSQNALHWVNQDLSVEKKFTYRHFARQSHRIALLFDSLGIRAGDVCVLITPRLPVWWEIVTACLRSGVIVCPCTTLLVDKDIEYRIQASHATAFIGDEVSVAKALAVRKNCPRLKTIFQIGRVPPVSDDNVVLLTNALSEIPETTHFAVPQSLQPTSPAMIYFTSGTTGPPKMVLHSHISYPLAHALTGAHWLELDTSCTYWNLSEQGWAKAAYSFFSAWNLGATLFVHDDREAFDPVRTLRVLDQYPITTLCAPPTVYRKLILDEHRPLLERLRKTLRHATGAGEPLNAHVIEKWREVLGMTIYDGFGQTETIVLCANQAVNPVRSGSMGKPLPGVPLKLIDPHGEEVDAAGVEGDMAVQVDSHSGGFFGIFKGYIDMETGALDRRLKTFANGKRFYLCGDRATRDDDGYFWFVGRGDDVINSAGYRIGPFEVESTLKLHPAVVESAAVASPDPERDEVVKAFVVLTDAAAGEIAHSPSKARALREELQEFCKRNAAPYKYPRKMEFVPAAFLPKTISGKIRRAELKKLERRRYLGPTSAKL